MTKIHENKFTILTTIVYGSKEFAFSIDFDKASLGELMHLLPGSQRVKIGIALVRRPFEFHSETEELLFGVATNLGHEMHSNNEEQYVPFVVEKFFRYHGAESVSENL